MLLQSWLVYTWIEDIVTIVNNSLEYSESDDIVLVSSSSTGGSAIPYVIYTVPLGIFISLPSRVNFNSSIAKSAQKYCPRLIYTSPPIIPIPPPGPELRLRIGDYRCLFFIDQENRIYIITQIGTRGDIYKK